MMQPPAYSEQRLLGMPLGQLYDVVTNGVRNMPAYGDQIPVRDRWAVAAYVRVLQRRRAAPLEQVPEAEANSRGWSKK
jgi:mono/diheme cytochrome c family protein